MWAQEQQRQLSGMGSVWQIPPWAPLLVPVLDCHTHLADASSSWRESYQTTQGLWPCEDVKVPRVFISTTQLTQTCGNIIEVVIPKWLLPDPFPEKTWSCLQDLVCHSPAHLLSRCRSCIYCCFFLSCNSSFAGRWFGFLKSIQGRQDANEQTRC